MGEDHPDVAMLYNNLGNKLVIMNKCYQLKEGMSYVVNTIMPHSAFNGGFDNRVTLVYHILGYKSNNLLITGFLSSSAIKNILLKTLLFIIFS